MIEFDVAFRPGDDFAVTFGGEVPLDAEMGQVMEVLATEERTVELSMPSGNQVILPTSSKGLRKVTIQKPDTLLSENIKKDVVIGGVTGDLEAPPTGPYIEYTSLDSSGRVFTAKFRGTIVPEYAFAYLAELTQVDMPDNVIAIGDNGFYRCPKLSLTSLPSGITSLPTAAFQYCPKLALTTFPSGMTSIGAYAFKQGTGLASITLPPALTAIGNQAFANCYNLKVCDCTECTAVPTLGASVFQNAHADFKILVPSALEEEWKAAANWSSYASQIIGV